MWSHFLRWGPGRYGLDSRESQGSMFEMPVGSSSFQHPDYGLKEQLWDGRGALCLPQALWGSPSPGCQHRGVSQCQLLTDPPCTCASHPRALSSWLEKPPHSDLPRSHSLAVISTVTHFPGGMSGEEERGWSWLSTLRRRLERVSPCFLSAASMTA